MRELRVNMDHGFEGELVVLRLTGSEIYRFHPRDGESYRTTLTTNRNCFEVEIPSRGVFGSSAITSGEESVAIRLRLESSGVLAFEIRRL